ncbi:MAG: hypothetical protein ACLFNI_11890, partial [Natronomonas sp.]
MGFIEGSGHEHIREKKTDQRLPIIPTSKLQKGIFVSRLCGGHFVSPSNPQVAVVDNVIFGILGKPHRSESERTLVCLD